MFSAIYSFNENAILKILLIKIKTKPNDEKINNLACH